MNLKSKILNIGFYLLCMAFGYLIARFISIPFLEISRSIDITNILNLMVTILLAIIVTVFFEKRNSNHRVEKDLIINKVGDVINIAASLQIESHSGKVHISEASSSIKRINTSLKSIYGIVDKCHFQISREIKTSIRNSISDLRDILTNTPILFEDEINGQQLSIEIKESIIFYARERVSQIEVKFEKLKDLLLELQIDINKK